MAKAEEVDTTRTGSPPSSRSRTIPKPFFQDKDYYKKVLSGEGDEGTRVHDLLGKYMKAEDPEEKSHFRAQLISALLGAGRQGRLPGRTGTSSCPSGSCCASASSPPASSPPSCATWCRASSSRTPPASPSATSTNGWSGSPGARCGRPPWTRSRPRPARTPVRRSWMRWRRKRASGTARSRIMKAKISQLEEREGQLRGQVDLLIRHDKNEEYWA